jgi:hypothetical protein
MSGTSASLTQSGSTATASLKATSVTTLAASGATTLSGTLGVTGATTMTSLGTSGDATVGGTLGVTGATTTTSLTNTGNATVGGTLGVTGNTTLSGTLNVTGTTTVNKLAVQTFQTIEDTLDVYGDTSLYGTVTVGNSMTVGGDLTVSNDIYVDSNRQNYTTITGTITAAASVNLLTTMSTTYGTPNMIEIHFNSLRPSTTANIYCQLSSSNTTSAYIGSTSGTSNLAHASQTTAGMYLWDTTLANTESVYGSLKIRACVLTGGQRYYIYSGQSSNGSRTVSIAGRINWSLGTGNTPDTLLVATTAGTFTVVSGASSIAIEYR